MLEHVSKSLARDPFVRALSMKAWPQADGSMIVTGGSTPHTLFAFRNGWKCDCTAAEYGAFCAHLATVNHKLQQKQQGEAMALAIDRPTGSDRGIPVPLPRPQKMLYAGLFSDWFTTENQYGTSIGIKVLVTHTSAGKSWEKLDEITEALTFVKSSLWHNDKKNESSHLALFVSALTGATPAAVVAMTAEQVVSAINAGVGTGILFAASVEKSEKYGDTNLIDKESFSEADAAFAPIAQTMNAKIVVKQNKDGNSYIDSPKPTLVKQGEVADIRESLESEVPF